MPTFLMVQIMYNKLIITIMYIKMFTKEQINDLLNNKCVIRCSKKAITYHSDFKARAVRRYYDEGIPPMEIFTDAGFDPDVIGAKTPKECLRRWRKTFKAEGSGGLSKDGRGDHGRGDRPKTKNLTDKERIEYLKAKVAYLKAENDFLAKLRAARKE